MKKNKYIVIFRASGPLKNTYLADKLAKLNYKIKDYPILKVKKIYTKVELSYFQSNVEGELINCIQEVGFESDGIILNAAAYTHTSIGISDAIKSINIPVYSKKGGKAIDSVKYGIDSAKNNNKSHMIAKESGVQFIAMNFQKFDAAFKMYSLLFDAAGSAFILKPDHLRFHDVTLDDPSESASLPDGSVDYNCDEADSYRFSGVDFASSYSSQETPDTTAGTTTTASSPTFDMYLSNLQRKLRILHYHLNTEHLT